MDLALAIARSGLDAHHKNIEVISNNLANANTTAYKKSRPEFEDLPYSVIKQPGSATSQDTNTTSGLVLGTGTKLANNKKIFTDGSLMQTDNQLDIAIKGNGFLKVQLPNGSDYAYTRAGALQMNEQGQLVMPNGYIIQPPISIPTTGVQKIEISNDGMVNVYVAGSTTPQQVGQLELTDFINPDGLEPIGENLYKISGSSGPGTSGTPGLEGYGTIKQGALEGSNVNVVEEMVNLIEAQRAFEVTSKAVSAVDNMMQNLTRET
ncbi:MAG: flagellar basal-body rod protein FlgG [Gammaproteobacteria bacterium]|nr:flagellar basal-body rod protein FlgG [Gammaproteobacteria bacterium]